MIIGIAAKLDNVRGGFVFNVTICLFVSRCLCCVFVGLCTCLSVCLKDTDTDNVCGDESNFVSVRQIWRSCGRGTSEGLVPTSQPVTAGSSDTALQTSASSDFSNQDFSKDFLKFSIHICSSW